MPNVIYTITAPVAPRAQFYTPDGNSITIRIFDSALNIEWELDINASTWAALVNAMTISKSTYIPGNDNSFKGDGSMNPGGKLQSETWPGDSTSPE